MAAVPKHDTTAFDRTWMASGVVVLAYVCAAVAAVFSVARMRAMVPDAEPWQVIAVADVVGTVIVFGFSVATRNSSMYDPYWSVAPPCIAAYLLWLPGPADDRPMRQFVVVGLVAWWGVRLTFNWWRQWSGLKHEDWRYVDLRERCGRAYWLVSFAGIHMFPTVLVYLGCLALDPVLRTGTAEVGALDALALVVTAGAIVIESTADRQLRDFVRSRPPREAVLEQGLWAISRHPNYLGEVCFWWGLTLFAIAASPSSWWVVCGPVAITVLFVFVSIPMIERRMLARRPHFSERMRRVPALFPHPWGRARRRASL